MNALAPLENATVVVTGASGFIGSHLVDYLVEGGCTVYALIRKTSDLKWLRQSDRVKLYLADLTQSDLSLPFLDHGKSCSQTESIGRNQSDKNGGVGYLVGGDRGSF